MDSSKVSAMREKNEAKLKEFEAKLEDAQTNAGEQEIRDVLLARAEYLAKLGDREGATKAFEATEAKTSGVGNKMDLVFSQIRWDGRDGQGDMGSDLVTYLYDYDSMSTRSKSLWWRMHAFNLMPDTVFQSHACIQGPPCPHSRSCMGPHLQAPHVL